MPRLLVVVDGSPEAAEALERAMDVADAVPGSELILLCIEPDPPAWELKRPRRLRTGTKQIIARARSTVGARGIEARTRVERGEKGDVVTRVAAQENCDQIFVAETQSTLASRICLAVAGACTGRVAGRIISATGLPVTVIAPKSPR
ncbi:MAG: universal stress protein [Hyphomicrobium sp.]|nr:universal stress protein [Hyphomicrobium sp.]